MKRKESLKELIILVILLSPIIFMFIVWDKVPESVPMHWNLKGEIDNYGPKYLYAVLNAALYIILLIIPKIDPRKRHYTIFSTTYYKLRLILTLFTSLLFSLVIIHSLYAKIDFGKFFPAAILFLIAVIGNYLGTVRSNWFIGIRTPWTLDNEEVWRKTHIFGGRLWFYGGIGGAILTLFLPQPLSQYFAFAYLVTLSIITILYSYFCFRKLDKNKTYHRDTEK